MKLNELFENDYRMSHTAPVEDSAPLFNVTLNDIYPDDIYTSNGLRLYSSGVLQEDKIAHGIIMKYKNKPNGKVKIYRAVPRDVTGEIGNGDWVSISPSYAKQHGEKFKNGGKMLTKMVLAKQLFTDGNSWSEWGYLA